MPKPTNTSTGKPPTETSVVRISAPNFAQCLFHLKGKPDSPLVIHRFSQKVKNQLLLKQTTGKAASSKKERKPQKKEDTFNEARYISKEGWDGVQASAFRKAFISACRLVNFKMTLAKLSIFVVSDGSDRDEPQIPLVRIYGTPLLQEDMARVETGQPYITIRPAYHDWKIQLKMRWDADQFTQEDIANLLIRVGEQVGIGEGRPDSKNSAGMGWGLFDWANQ